MAAVRRRERLEYIADMLQQLERMAEVEKEYFLGYVIGMARLEAKYGVGAGTTLIRPVNLTANGQT